METREAVTVAEDDLHWVVTRKQSTQTGEVAEGLLIPGHVDPQLPWEQLNELAVSSWGGCSDVDDVNERQRTDEMLLQFGWERSHGPRGAHYFPVRRATVMFRATPQPTAVDILSPDDVVVASYPLGSDDVHAVLEQGGWLVTHALDERSVQSWAVRPFDWPRVVRYVSLARKSAQAKAEAAELGWREVVRSALLAGQDASTLATLTGLTRQRIYQLRDGRR